MLRMEITTINQAPPVCQYESLHLPLVLTDHQKVEIGAPILLARKLRFTEVNSVDCPNSHVQ